MPEFLGFDLHKKVHPFGMTTYEEDTGTIILIVVLVLVIICALCILCCCCLGCCVALGAASAN